MEVRAAGDAALLATKIACSAVHGARGSEIKPIGEPAAVDSDDPRSYSRRSSECASVLSATLPSAIHIEGPFSNTTSSGSSMLARTSYPTLPPLDASDALLASSPVESYELLALDANFVAEGGPLRSFAFRPLGNKMRGGSIAVIALRFFLFPGMALVSLCGGALLFAPATSRMGARTPRPLRHFCCMWARRPGDGAPNLRISLGLNLFVLIGGIPASSAAPASSARAAPDYETEAPDMRTDNSAQPYSPPEPPHAPHEGLCAYLRERYTTRTPLISCIVAMACVWGGRRDFSVPPAHAAVDAVVDAATVTAEMPLLP